MSVLSLARLVLASLLVAALSALGPRSEPAGVSSHNQILVLETESHAGPSRAPRKLRTLHSAQVALLDAPRGPLDRMPGQSIPETGQ